MNEYGNRVGRSAWTGVAPRSLAQIGWSSTFDPEPGFWRRLLTWLTGH